jgi:hypothetical protein
MVPPGTRRIYAVATVSLPPAEGVSYQSRLITGLGSSEARTPVVIDTAISDADRKLRLVADKDDHRIKVGDYITAAVGFAFTFAGSRVIEVDGRVITTYAIFANSNYGNGQITAIGEGELSTTIAEPTILDTGARQAVSQWSPGGVAPIPIQAEAKVASPPTAPTITPVAFALAMWRPHATAPSVTIPVPHSVSSVAVYAVVDPERVGDEVHVSSWAAGRLVTETPMVALRETVRSAVQYTPTTHLCMNFSEANGGLGTYPEVTGDAWVDGDSPWMRDGSVANGQGERAIWRGRIHIPHAQRVTMRWQGLPTSGAPTVTIRLRRVRDDAIMLATTGVSGTWMGGEWITRSSSDSGGVSGGRLTDLDGTYSVTMQVGAGTGTMATRFLGLYSDGEDGYTTGS